MGPLSLGSEQEFTLVREYLQQSGYTLRAVVERLQVELPYEFTLLKPGTGGTGEPADALELLLRLFVRGESATPEQLARLMPAEVCAAMSALGLLMAHPEPPARVCSPVALCPVANVLITSDRWSAMGSEKFLPAQDSVYPALTVNAQIFLNSLSHQPCARLLDVCAGTGVAALIAASEYATEAIAADLTERCTQFAEFNRRLNGLNNVMTVQSDVYSALGGESFDRIVAHPPYVPVLERKWYFRDGGNDGEEITRRLLEGLPGCLAPGGVFQCHTSLSDRDQPVERRIREWLGEKQDEFDVVLVIWGRVDTDKFALAAAMKNDSMEELHTWKKLFEEWKVRELLDVSILVTRHAAPARALDVRRNGGSLTRYAEVEWLLNFQRVQDAPQTWEALMRSHPVAAEGLNLTVKHVIEEEELRAAHCRAAIEYPFRLELDLDRWMPLLLAACNGRRSGLELFELMRQQGHIPEDAEAGRFAMLLAVLVSSGFVHVAEFATPAAQQRAAVSA